MRTLIIFISILFLASCASQSKMKDEHDLTFHLTQKDIGTLPNPKIKRTIEDQQLLTTEVKGYVISFMSVLKRSDSGIQLTALSAVGVRLFIIDYDGITVKTTKYIPDMRLPDVNDIMANIMLAYYDGATWKANLPQNWSIKDQGLSRQILNQDGIEIITIDYKKQNKLQLPIKITNNILKYTINLKNLND